MEYLRFLGKLPLVAENGGLFVSTGTGCHPKRIIASHELIFVRSGCLQMEEAERRFAVAQNESLLLWPGRVHRGVSDYTRDLSFYWVHFRVTARNYDRSAVRLPQHGRPANPERMAELFHRFLDDQESGALGSERAALLVMLMLLEIPEKPAQPAGPDHALAGRVRACIATNFHRGIHAGDVASMLGYNADYLGRVYRRVHGYALSHAIHVEQVRKARILLRETGRNLDEIAAACGFAGSRYFRKLFTAFQGMSPRDYRRLYARLHINTH